MEQNQILQERLQVEHQRHLYAELISKYPEIKDDIDEDEFISTRLNKNYAGKISSTV